MYTGAMNSHRIFDEECEQKLLPSGLYAALVIKAHEQKRLNADKGAVGGVVSQYRRMQDPEKGGDFKVRSFRNLRASNPKNTTDTSCKFKFKDCN